MNLSFDTCAEQLRLAGYPQDELISLHDEPATLRFAGALAEALNLAAPSVSSASLITLQGELGSGKSTLIRALLRALGHQGAVPSPTYALVEPYVIDRWRIAHLDLYRLADGSELDALGWRDLIAEQDLLLVEWPERAAGFLPEPWLELQLGHADEGRQLRLKWLD